eukprot:c2452_g2_i1 orf=123-554(-)
MESLQEMQPDDGGSFVKDEFYESIQAPQWLDFDSPEPAVDDHEWFCKRAGCTHEKRPFCREQPVKNSYVTNSQPEATFNVLQTIPEEISMNRQGCGRPSNTATLKAPTSNAAALMAPTFAQRLGIHCDNFAYPLMATFFCCFP